MCQQKNLHVEAEKEAVVGPEQLEGPRVTDEGWRDLQSPERPYISVLPAFPSADLDVGGVVEFGR